MFSNSGTHSATDNNVYRCLSHIFQLDCHVVAGRSRLHPSRGWRCLFRGVFINMHPFQHSESIPWSLRSLAVRGVPCWGNLRFCCSKCVHLWSLKIFVGQQISCYVAATHTQVCVCVCVGVWWVHNNDRNTILTGILLRQLVYGQHVAIVH